MKCMYAQTRPRFILSSERVFGGMEFEPMLTPREKSPLPKMSPEEDRTRHAVDSEPKHYQLSYSGPLKRVLQANTLASLSGHSDRVLAVAADTQGRVVTAGLDRSLRLWSPHLHSDLKISGQHNVEVTSLAAGLDGKSVLTSDR